MSRTPECYTRIQWLHEQIRAFRYPNAQRLSERFGVSHRQGQRDLRYLREELGAPLAYAADRRGFYYTDDFFLPVYIRNVGEGDYIDLLDTQIAQSAEPLDPAASALCAAANSLHRDATHF